MYGFNADSYHLCPQSCRSRRFFPEPFLPSGQVGCGPERIHHVHRSLEISLGLALDLPAITARRGPQWSLSLTLQLTICDIYKSGSMVQLV